MGIRVRLRRSREAQRGSLIVTVFMVVLGMTLVLASVNALLKEQMRQSLDIKNVSIGRLQALYLAEMGVNEFMFTANQAGTLPMVPDTYVFKADVAMTRNDPAGVAETDIKSLGGGKYEAIPHLTTKDGPFDIPYRIVFAPRYDATDKVWVLQSYEVVKK